MRQKRLCLTLGNTQNPGADQKLIIVLTMDDKILKCV